MKILFLIVVSLAAVAALEQWMNDFPRESIDAMILNFETLERIGGGYRRSDDFSADSPFKKIIYRKVKQIRLPIYIHAKINRSHLPSSERRSSIPRQVIDLLRYTDSSIYDEAGHLLAYSLGGGMDNHLNYAPMAICLNRGDYSRTETEISTFLKENRNGEVDWHLVVIYDKDLRNHQGSLEGYDVSTNRFNLRPIGFCLKYNTKVSANAPSVNGVKKCFYNITHPGLESPKN